jgi:putative N6-adenine-specific DNA methylase
MNLFDKEGLDIVVTCASGIEKVLKSEVKRLGYPELPVLDGELVLKGDASAIAKLNLNLRTADRVYIKLAEFPVLSFDDLYDGVRAIDWRSILTKDANVSVDEVAAECGFNSMMTFYRAYKKVYQKTPRR